MNAKAVLLMAVAAMTGCGGGGGSGDVGNNNSPLPPNPPPTISLETNGTVHPDERLDITWSSSNATGCTAAGDWSGARPKTGSESFILTSVGTYSFELSCDGPGGTIRAERVVTITHDPDKQVALPDSIVVEPANLLTSYPAAFEAVPAEHVANNPYCVIAADEVVVPAAFLGSYPLPTPADRLPTGMKRGIGLKDYHPINPSSANPCPSAPELARASYRVTLDRMVRLGVDHVWVYNYAPWRDLTQQSWDIDRSQLQIPDEELVWLVTEANQRGIEVFLEWQMLPYDQLGNELSSSPGEAELEKMIEAHRQIIVERAAHAQSIGISGITADWTVYWISTAEDHRTTISAGMLEVLQAVRPAFEGQIMYGFLGIIDPEHLPYFDLLRIELQAVVDASDLPTLSVDELRAKYLEHIENLWTWGWPTSKPVLWYPLIQSRPEFFTTGWVEDGFCVQQCIQRSYTTDYSVQAMGVEALFQAVSTQNRFESAGIALSSSYWHSDVVMPSPETDQAAFPNISQSIRNKPAEAIVHYWYAQN